jgi:hypothetical protein
LYWKMSKESPLFKEYILIRIIDCDNLLTELTLWVTNPCYYRVFRQIPTFWRCLNSIVGSNAKKMVLQRIEFQRFV